MLSENLNFDVKNMMWVAFVGIIIKLFVGTDTSTDGMSGPASAAIWGYGIITLAILAILFVTFAMTSRMAKINDMNTVSFLKIMFMHSVPSILMLGILSWLISINAIHYKQINEGKTAEEYDTYSSVSTWLVIAQVAVLIKLLIDELNINKSGVERAAIMQALQGKMASVSYLLTITNVFALVIMTIILTYFSTDG